MTERNSKSGTPLTPNKSSDQKTNTAPPNPTPPVSFTEVYDELDDVRSMNYFLYDALEALYAHPDEGRHQEKRHLGLVLWLRHLRERDQAVMEKLARLKPPR